jgi:DNA-binding transcriptional MerR regulator
VRDRSVEHMFLAIYSAPVLQALVGIRASDESPRRQPGIEPERIAFIRERIREIKERIAEGRLREAAIRSGVCIGMAGSDFDERALDQLRQIRAAHDDLTLEEFKRMLREQFFALRLDPDGALAAIPRMVSADAAARREALAAIRAVVSAAGEVTGERARRLARIETILGEPAPTPALHA